MPWPLSQDYNEAVQNPALRFSDAELKQTEARGNAIGIPMARSGNFADVYEMTGPGGKKWALKCFTREVPDLRERYAAISAYLKQANLPFMVDFSYLEQGVKVKGQWYPALKMDWVEGFVLNQFVKEHADNPPILELLCQIWVRLARRLREAKMAHCDLQHGNVLLVPGSTAKSLAVKLIDYDGMFVPALAKTRSGEVGHPAYQHPQRLRDGTYTAEVDRFPHLVIYTALRSLMVGSRYLWNKYDNGDNLLFRQSDLEAPSKSPLFAELMKLNDPEVRKLAQTLAQAAQKPLEEAPLLDDLVGSSTATTARRKSAVVTPSAAAAPATKETSAEAIFAEATAETGERRARPAKKSYLGAAVVGGVALVGLIVGGVMLAMNGKSKTPSPEVALAPTNPERPSPVVEPGKSGPMKDPDPVKEPPKPEAPQPPLLSFVGHTGPVKCLVLTPDGKQVISCSGWPKGDYTIRVWDLANGKQLRHINVDGVSPPPGGDGPQFAALAISPDGSRLLAGTSHRLALMWDLAAGKELYRLEGHEGGIQAATFTPDGRQALTGCADNVIRVWDSSTGKLLKELKGHKEWVRTLAVTPDGKKLLSGGRDKTVFLWDLENGELLRQFEGEHPGWIEMVVLSRDGKTALSAGDDIRVWDVDTGRMIRELENSKKGNLCLAWSPDEKWVAASGYSRVVRLWNFATGKQVAALPEHRNWVWDVVFTRDGKYLLSAGGGQGNSKEFFPGDDFAIRRWDLAHYLYTVEDAPKELTNSIGMKLALIPTGKFLMGSPDTEPGREAHEGPQHEVTLTRPFYMGIHEVTVAQFREFVKATGYLTDAERSGGASRPFADGTFQKDPKANWQSPAFEQTDTHPVVCVSWNDAEAFCDWLSQKEGQLYRLPTEAEWEYSCRAGTTTRWYNGDDDQNVKAVANVADASLKRKMPNTGGYAYASWDDGHPYAAPVGSFQPNAFGLYDMHGNAMEWCQDWYDQDYYKNSPKQDPQGPSSGAMRVVRGGTWSREVGFCRAACRVNTKEPNNRSNNLGFRVSRSSLRGHQLLAVSGGDGSFEVVKENGIELRRGTLRDTGDYQPYMYFRLPELAPRSKQPAYIQVVYRHAGSRPLRAHYNAVNSDNYRFAEVSYAHEPIGTSQTRTAVIELPQPEFRQAQNQKADLRLINPDRKQPLRVISATLYVEPTPLFIRSNTGSSMPPPPVSARRPAPVPDAAAQDKALKQIRDLFKDDYAKRKPADQLVLAAKLLKQAAQTKDDAAGRYVLYREARDLAAQAGDPVQAFKAVDDMAKEFAVPAPPLRVLVVETVSKVARTRDALKTLAETAMPAVDEAVDVDDYPSADRILKVAETAAYRIKDNALVKTVQERKKVVDGLSVEFRKVREAAKTLEMKPDDADANLAMGRFLCFHKEQWNKGLPLLAKGADQPLRDLARKDLAAPADPAAQSAVGDGWWDLALKTKGSTKLHLQRQACAWYERALPQLSGLAKAKVDKRLAAVGPTVGRSQPKELTNSIGMKLTLIPAGKFQMGSPSTEADRSDSETQHDVSISKAFHMAIHKVTVGQFKAFVKDTGYRTDGERGGGSQGPLGDGKWGTDPKVNWQTPGFEQTDEHPVVCLSWNDAQAFCIWLSRKEKKNYALPTEAQWEYACRAGTQSRYGFGNTDAELPQYAWYWANAGKMAHPVGQRKPNAWGLYDMHGNAWEWCQDYFDPDYYKTSPRQDPPGPAAGGNRVARGGAWNSGPIECRAAHRLERPPAHRSVGFGFRVVLLH